MANKYVQTVNSAKTRFTQAPMGELEFSTMYSNPTLLTDFSGGEIIPIYCAEVLPHDTFEMGMDFVIRQATVATPTMGVLNCDFYAFFVPNRVVNRSWKNVMGENSSGAWANDEVITLAPLYTPSSGIPGVQVPVGSVADYYGYPTQGVLPADILSSCHDLKFRGYLEIYNTYFRDQNYQPPIPYSKLNIYNGFFEGNDTEIGLLGTDTYSGTGSTNGVPASTPANGQYGAGAFVKDFAGDGGKIEYSTTAPWRVTSWSALGAPLKANKLHDYFTSVLPTPQKGNEVVVPVFGRVNLNADTSAYRFDSRVPLKVLTADEGDNPFFGGALKTDIAGSNLKNYDVRGYDVGTITDQGASGSSVLGTNMYGELESYSITIPELRMSSAMQQVYEILGRGGSRYTEYINSFFGLEIDNPFDDIPTYLGHFREELDLFQTAQTSATPTSDNAGTAQGNLAAFGYTSKSGKLFTKTFNEHGYVHVFAVVRHRNIYSSSLARDNFRMSMMDFYQYPLANITEQPVYTREINPFVTDAGSQVFGYQEAWAEYRMEPDRVSAHMRPGVPLTLANWNYADDYYDDLAMADGDWLISNTDEVVRRSTAVQDQGLPQFKGQFMFHIKKQRPMPTYSVAGLDII